MTRDDSLQVHLEHKGATEAFHIFLDELATLDAFIEKALHSSITDSLVKDENKNFQEPLVGEC